MINRKEKKKEIAQFATMMKDLMGKDDLGVLETLDRDLQNFMYSRIGLLVRHNDGQPIGSLGDIGAVVGSALFAVVSEFTKTVEDSEELASMHQLTQQGFMSAYEHRYNQVIQDAAPVQDESGESAPLATEA